MMNNDQYPTKCSDTQRSISLIMHFEENHKFETVYWRYEVRRRVLREGGLFPSIGSKEGASKPPPDDYLRPYYRPKQAFPKLLDEATSLFEKTARTLRLGWSFWS